MLHQSMSGFTFDRCVKLTAQTYAHRIASGEWSIEHAHSVLKSSNLDLVQIAALAKVIACFQCDGDALLALAEERSKS